MALRDWPCTGLCALILGLATPRAAAQDAIRVEEKLEVLVLQPQGSVVPGQAFALGVRILVDEKFLEQHMVQLFRQALDLPIQIEAPWLDSFPGLQLESLGEHKDGLSLVLNQTQTKAREGPRITRNGREFRSFELLRSAIASDPGEFPLAAPKLRVAFATSFRDELLATRVPLDRTDSTIHGTASVFAVRPFPERDRPLSFVDAVGQFSIHASVSDEELEAGQALSLTIRIEGSGNFASLTPPRVDNIMGWRLQGVGVARESNVLLLVATLAPNNSRVGELPAVEFAWYDPSIEMDDGEPYQLARTPLFSIKVRQPKLPAGKDESIDGEITSKEPEDNTGRQLLIGGSLTALAAAALWIALRRKPAKGSQHAARAAGVQAAQDRFESSPSDDSTARNKALRSYLADVFDCTEAVLHDHDFASRMVAHGIPNELAARVQRSLEEFDAAQFGGGPQPTEDIPELVRALAQALLRINH